MSDEKLCSKSMARSLSSRTFGHLRTGESIEAWTLVGAGSLVVEIITYGGIVLRLLAPDRDGCLADVVLGFNDLDSYLAEQPSGYPYFGAIIGRVAGRVTGGAFDLEGKTYELARNDPPNHLHGGVRGFDKRIWIATPKMSGEAVSLQLTYCSPDGEEGYPGTVKISVTYTVTSENVLLIATEAITDVSTPFNLTHHSYFNLGGEAAGSIGQTQMRNGRELIFLASYLGPANLATAHLRISPSDFSKYVDLIFRKTPRDFSGWRRGPLPCRTSGSGRGLQHAIRKGTSSFFPAAGSGTADYSGKSAFRIAFGTRQLTGTGASGTELGMVPALATILLSGSPAFRI